MLISFTILFISGRNAGSHRITLFTNKGFLVIISKVSSHSVRDQGNVQARR